MRRKRDRGIVPRNAERYMLDYTTIEPEKDEYIEITKLKLNDLLDMISKGDILDCKTIVGALTVNNYIKK